MEMLNISDTPELPDEVGHLGSAFFTEKKDFKLEQIIIDNRYWIIYKHNFYYAVFDKL